MCRYINYPRGDNSIMKINGTLNQKGFSLVELMIVVAIIGLLAAVGVPQYQKFQARARQGEAKSSLSALYSSTQSFYGEWNYYTADLADIGFGVTGTGLRYVTGFVGICSGYPAPGATFGGPAQDAGNIWSDSATVCQNGAAQWGTGATPACTAYFARPAGAGSCDNTAGGAASTFVALSGGNPNNSFTPAAVDVWTINQVKLIRNVTNGIR